MDDAMLKTLLDLKQPKDIKPYHRHCGIYTDGHCLVVEYYESDGEIGKVERFNSDSVHVLNTVNAWLNGY